MATFPDPFDKAIVDDPYDYYSRLREEAPCHFVEPHGFYTVSRFEDLVSVVRNHKVFSSTGGVGPEWASQPMLSMYDPPEHGRIRKQIMPMFNPGGIATFQQQKSKRIDDLADELVVAALQSGRVEVHEQIAVPLALSAVADIIGLPRDRDDDLIRWGDGIVDDLGCGRSPERMARARNSIRECIGYLKGIMAEGALNPDHPGVLGHVRQCHAAGHLTEREMNAFGVLLLGAGFGTLAIAIENTLHALATHPDQWELLVANPELVDKATNEALRYNGAVQSFFRNTLEDAEVAGVRIPKGSKVQVIFASANRDEARFEQADVYRIKRKNPPGAPQPVSYGVGIHYCVGAPLARVVLRSVVQSFLKHVKSFSLAGPVEYDANILFRIVSRMHLDVELR